MEKTDKYAILRKIGYAEAASYLLLLLVAMPLKYFAGIGEAVTYTGWAHGVLFMAYVFWLLVDGVKNEWKFLWYVYGYIAALLPFGPIVFDRKILDSEK